MKITAIALILLAYGVVCELTALRFHHPLRIPSPAQIFQTSAQAAQPVPKRKVDCHAIIRSAAQKHNVPAAFVQSIVAAESNFNPDAVSPKGAVGLMQLMPATAQEYGADPAIPEQNVDAGTRYLGTLLKRYSMYRNGLSRAIAAYNAGPAVVDKYRGVPPYRETRSYVTRVLGYLHEFGKDSTEKVAMVIHHRRGRKR